MIELLDIDRSKELTKAGIRFPANVFAIHTGETGPDNMPVSDGYYLRIGICDLLSLIPQTIYDDNDDEKLTPYNFRMEFNDQTKKWQVGHFRYGMSYFINVIDDDEELLNAIQKYVLRLVESCIITV